MNIDSGNKKKLNNQNSIHTVQHDTPPQYPDSVKMSRPRLRSHKNVSRVFFFALFCILITSIAGFQQIFFAKETIEPLKTITRLPVIRDIRNIVGANNNLLKGESKDRINIVIFGQGGPGHPGPYLTDTIIFASVKPSTGQVALLSIPRDMVVDIPGIGLDRINAANAYGETSNYPGGGAAFSARIIEDTLKQQVNYYVRVDFTGFEQIIDEIGPLEVDVERAFTDIQYPDGELGYQIVRFDAGPQKMNGEQALKYVRSRHGNNGEGSDFARARRQQKLLLALKDTLLSPSYILNPAKLISIYKKADKHISTNAQLWEITSIIKLAKDFNFEAVSFKVLDDSPAGPLYSTTTKSGQYVLAPKISDYSEIQFIANNLFTINDIKNEESTLTIKNGTTQIGLAQNTADILQAFEFTVINIENAESKNYQKTVLYDLTGDAKPHSKKFLENTLQTKAQKTLPPTGAFEGTDFLIILGFDQAPNTQVQEFNALEEDKNS